MVPGSRIGRDVVGAPADPFNPHESRAVWLGGRRLAEDLPSDGPHVVLSRTENGRYSRWDCPRSIEVGVGEFIRRTRYRIRTAARALATTGLRAQYPVVASNNPGHAQRSVEFGGGSLINLDENQMLGPRCWTARVSCSLAWHTSVRSLPPSEGGVSRGDSLLGFRDLEVARDC
jgi:hypothetical protein